MKRLLLVAVMVLVTLVGMVGVRSAAGQNESDVITQLQNIQQTLSEVSYYYTVSELQSTANPTNEVVTELLETVYDLDTVYDWETVYALEKVYARVPASAKMYYLTKNTFNGVHSITACDSGFHMASISEIQDPSSLQYATSISSAYVHPALDQGSGPPTSQDGWFRTGVSSEELPDPFSHPDDCSQWTSRSSAVFGPTVYHSNWDVPITLPTLAAWWIPSTSTCDSYVRVWCVEDPE